MVYRERKHFLTFSQMADETVVQWRMRLQIAAMDCKFGDHMNAFLVTRFICGLASVELFDELCRRLKQPVDQMEAAFQLVEECERDMKLRNYKSKNDVILEPDKSDPVADVVDTKSTSTAEPVKPKERKISRFQVSPTIVESEDGNDEASAEQDIPPKAPMVRRVSRFSISPAEIPDGCPATTIATTAVTDSTTIVVSSPKIEPTRKESVEHIGFSEEIHSPKNSSRKSSNTSIQTVASSGDIQSPTNCSRKSSNTSIKTVVPSPTSVPSITQLESQVKLNTSSEFKHKKSTPSSLESIPDIGSPSRKQSSPDMAWEQLKIGLENITHAQVVASVSKTSQSPVSDSIPDADSSPTSRSRPTTPPYQSVTGVSEDNKSLQTDMEALQMVLALSLQSTKKDGMTDKTPKKKQYRSNRRFIRRNHAEAQSKMHLTNTKSSYFDMDTIDMEYPRNLDSNIEMLGQEAEHMEEQFTATSDEKLLSYVPIDAKASDSIKESTIQQMSPVDNARDEDDPIGMSPCKRFFKYNKEVGFGSFKTVFRGLDTHTGVAVAWCELLGRKVKKAERQRFREEADMLKKLQNPNIVRFYDYWEITTGMDKRRNIVLVTELMLSGTLKSYLKRFKQINPKVFKSWCRQILKGLYFLHTRNPTIIHRDLKCDNIFITGTTGCVKIGDLGLATLKEGSFAKSIIGTPEFMAPEMYEEHYDESVDVYAFGMCMLEMTTSEYPYNECTGPAQIYKKVANGIKPESFYKITDERVKDIIEHCTQLKKEDRPDCKYLLNSDFFSDDTGLKLQPFAKEAFLNNPDCNRIEFRLRLLNSKQRQFKHREDEAIQFEFELGVDNTDELASDMFHAEIISEEDSRTVAKLLKVQITSMMKERRELSANRQQNETTTAPMHTDMSPEHCSSDPIPVPSQSRCNSYTIDSPLYRSCNGSPATMSPVSSPPLHSTPFNSTPSSRKTSNSVVSAAQQNGEHLTVSTPSRSKKSSRCDQMVPRLEVIGVSESMVECSMECMMKTITFKFDIDDVNPNEVASRLILQDLLDETQRLVFTTMFADVVKAELSRLKQDPNKVVMNGRQHQVSDSLV